MASDKMQTRPAQTAVAKTDSPKDRLASILDAMRPKIAAVLPKHLTPERMIQIVMVEAARNPKLRECTTDSLAASIILASELGLEPSGPLGQCYLIPRRNGKTGNMECGAQIGYKGYCELARRSGQIARLNAGIVYQEEIDRGLFVAEQEPPSIVHRWAPDVRRHDDSIVAVYATAELRDGSKAQAILSRADVEGRKARSDSVKRGYSSPWDSDYAAMARKTALRALLTGGLVPLSGEMAKAMVEADDAIDTTADEGPVEPKKKQPRANPLAGLLTSPEPKVEPDPEQEPEPPANPMVEEAVSACERYAVAHQGVIPDWMPESAIAITRLDDAHLSALLDRIASEEQG